MAYRYPTRKIDGRTKLLHRHLVEEKIGRPLRDDEHVHHKDHNPWNFDIDNLEIRDAVEHHQSHADERLLHPREKQCQVCGAIFTPPRTKRKRAKTCSPECANKLRTGRPPLAEALVRAQFPEACVQAVGRAAA